MTQNRDKSQTKNKTGHETAPKIEKATKPAKTNPYIKQRIRLN